MMMNVLMEELWAMILARLPLKSITSSKLVCKEWKSILESPFLRDLFLSHHQNSHTSWSLMSRNLNDNEIIAHYGCEIWGLTQSLSSYMSCFLNDNFEIDQEVKVVSYSSEVGLLLIKQRKPSYLYVANPISRQCVAIPPRPSASSVPVDFFRPSGLCTRVENGVVLGYTVVLMRTRCFTSHYVLDLLVYSSETGVWSFKTLRSPFPVYRVFHIDPVCLNGSLYWRGRTSCVHQDDVVVSHDFYAESDQYRVIFYPDLDKEPDFSRVCTASQGFLMYINSYKEDDASLMRVWRMLKTGEWELLSELSLARFDCFPLTMNPFDANTIYTQSIMHSCLASTHLHQAKFGLHINLERSLDGRILSFALKSEKNLVYREYFRQDLATFVLPRWLYRFPSPPS